MSSKRDADWRAYRAAREFVFGAEDDSEDDEDTDEDEDETGETKPPDDKAVAAMIDKAFADADEAEFFEQVKKNGIRIDITPGDPAWAAKRKKIQDELNIPTNTVNKVLDRYLTESQRLLFQPPLYAGDGAVLDIQKHNKVLYTEALRTGPFQGQKNNLITKIAMLHFGLPVEVMTLTNVVNAGTDSDDLEDADPEPPRVQRIMFAEKPLEFLDKYYERSHGYPMIRRTGRPLKPTGLVGLRGGAGAPPSEPHRLYSHYNGRQNLTAPIVSGHPVVPILEFRTLALRMVGIIDAGDWAFTVDQYRNQELNKNEAEKDLVRSFPVTKATFDHQYNQFIKARISNTLHDWVMVVRINTQPSPAPPKFILPLTDRLGDPPLYVQPQWAQVNVQRTKRQVYCHDQNKFEEFFNDSADFDRAWKQLLGLTAAQVPVTMKINFYSNQLDRGSQRKFHHHTRYNPIGGNRVFDSSIAPLMFDGTDNWMIAIHAYPTPDVPAEPLWPPWDRIPLTTTPNPEPMGARSKTNGRVYAPNGSAFRINRAPANSKKFLDAAKRALTLGNHIRYSFRIQCHSRQLDRVNQTGQTLSSYQYSHHLLVDQSTLDQVYNDRLSHYLFESGDDWYLRIVPTNDDSRLPAPAPLPPVGQSTEVTPNVTPVGSALPSPEIPPEGYIYGYAGKVKVGNNPQQVITAILKVLNINPSSPWWFRATIYKVDGTRDSVLLVRKSDYAQHLPAILASRVTTGDVEEDKGNYRVFVHISNSAPATYAERAPPRDYTSIVEVVMRETTAYCKIPNDMGTRYGINQYQPNFFKAMEIHFNSHLDRPRPHTNFMATDLGFGGMELGQQGLDEIRRLYLTNPGVGVGGTLMISNWPTHFSDQNTVGLRMIGNHRLGGADRGHYTDMGREIYEMCRTYTVGGLPQQFRLWRSARLRESDGESKLIDFARANRAAEIKELLERNNSPLNCLLFRPEWLKFTIIDGDSAIQPPPRVEWDIAAGSELQKFRQALVNLFKLSTPTITDEDAKIAAQSMELTNGAWDSGSASNSRFVITSRTTQDQWRRDVFDWLPGSEIIVIKKTGLDFVFDPTPVPWGITEIPFLPPPTDRPQDETSQQLTTSQPLIAAPPRFNKPRIVKPRAARPKPQKFDPWQAEQNRLNRLQRDSYIKDAYAIEPGQNPQPSIYGKARDNVLGVGQSMPEIYLKNLTATDIAQLELENRQIRNRNLDRQLTCGMCNAAFPANDQDAVLAHYKQHADAIASAGKCPLCETEGWVFMDMEHKKDHINQHYFEIETARIKDFWEGIRCPICQDDLHYLDPQKVIDHIAGHTPDIIRYCDRCGLDSNKSSAAELAHHEQTCRAWDETEDNVAPHFCGQCGKPRKESETDAERTAHGLICRPPPNENCEKCGFDLSNIFGEDYDSHDERCKPPRGWHGTFCRRCGRNISQMDETARRLHKKECLDRPPQAPSRDPRIAYMEGFIRKLNGDAYRLKAQRAIIIQKDKALQIRERAVANSQGAALIAERDDLQRQLNACLRNSTNRASTTTEADLQRQLNACTNLGLVDHGTCPIQFCERPAVGLLSRADLYAHLVYHSNNACFSCPLTKPDGQICTTQVWIKAATSKTPMIPDHLKHRGDGSTDQPADATELVELRAALELYRARLTACNESDPIVKAFWVRVVQLFEAIEQLAALSATITQECAQTKAQSTLNLQDLETEINTAFAAFQARPSTANQAPLVTLQSRFNTTQDRIVQATNDECDDKEESLVMDLENLKTDLVNLTRDRPGHANVEATDLTLAGIQSSLDRLDLFVRAASQACAIEKNTIADTLTRLGAAFIQAAQIQINDSPDSRADFNRDLAQFKTKLAEFRRNGPTVLDNCAQSKARLKRRLNQRQTRLASDASTKQNPMTTEYNTTMTTHTTRLANDRADVVRIKQTECEEKETALQADIRELEGLLRNIRRLQPATLVQVDRQEIDALEAEFTLLRNNTTETIRLCTIEKGELDRLIALLETTLAEAKRVVPPPPADNTAFMRSVANLQNAIDALDRTATDVLASCDSDKNTARSDLADLEPRVATAIAAQPVPPAPVTPADTRRLRTLLDDLETTSSDWDQAKNPNCVEAEDTLARNLAGLFNRLRAEITNVRPANLTPAESTAVTKLGTDLNALQVVVADGRTRCNQETAEIERRIRAVRTSLRNAMIRPPADNTAFMRAVANLQRAIDDLATRAPNGLQQCTDEKENAKGELTRLERNVNATTNAHPPAPVTPADTQILTDLITELDTLETGWNTAKANICDDPETTLANELARLFARLQTEITNARPASANFTQAETAAIARLSTDLDALQVLIDDARTTCTSETIGIERRIEAVRTSLTDLINRPNEVPEDDENPGGDDENQPEDNNNTGFLPSPPGGYRMRGSPKKASPRKRSAATASPSKAGSKRKMHIPEEDDSFVPMPYLEVGTPASLLPRSKRARTDAGSEDDYVIVGESMAAAAPARRSTRATSGTPAPGPSSLVVKKGRGRPKKELEDELEGDESDAPVANVRASPRKGSKQSPAKKK